MLQLPDNNNDLNGNPIRTTPGTTAGAGRENGYEPFGQTTGTVTGGGGIYTPPVQPNPTFVPPSFATNGIIKVVLSADENTQFTEDDKNVGIGNSITLQKTTFTFGDIKTYKAVKTGARAKNYFTVEIQKTFNTVRDLQSNQSTLVPALPPKTGESTILPTAKSANTNDGNTLTFGYNMAQPVTINDYLYHESISVKEFEYNEQTQTYNFLNERLVGEKLGVVNLQFTFIPEVVAPQNQTITYDIQFISNLKNELGDTISLSYSIVHNNGQIIQTDSVKLSDGNLDGKQIDTDTLKNCSVKFSILGKLPAGYSYNKISYKSITQSKPQTVDNEDEWKDVNETFSFEGLQLKGGVVVNATVEKVSAGVKPQLTLSSITVTKEIKETEADGTANIVFSPSNTDIVDVYLPDGDSFRVKAYQGYVPISFAKNFKGVYGLKKVILVPFNDAYGSGDRYEVLVNFVAINEFPNITQILFPTEVEVPSFSDGNLSWSVSYFTNNVSSVDVDLLLKDNSRITLYKSLPQNSAFNVNIKDLATKFPLWNGSQNLTLILKPYNRSGEKELVGNEYQISTNIIYPSIKLDEDVIRKSIYDAFIDNFDFIEPEKESKYLTHIINLGNDDRVLISSWEEDNWTLSDKGQDELGNTIVTKEVKSLILKLYEPLPADVQVNSTLWITKLMTNPLVETIIINEQYEEETPFIRGPNFNIEVDFVKGMSTDYESLDDLIISSSSSTQLIQTYLSGSNISMYDLNIQYVKESNTISPPSNFQATILYNAPAGAFFANGYEHNYRIYSYIDTGNGNRIYSHAYSTLQTNLADNNLGDNYEIYAFWDKVDGADGYRVLKYDTFDSNNYTAGYDTQLTHFYERNVTGGIDEAGFDGRVEYYNVQSADIAGAYAWENFVHFSSAEDRIKNFIYKVQLIEDYDLGIATAASSSGCIVGTGEWTGSITAQQEVERLTAKKYSLIQGFDGFETFLYTYNSEYSSDTKYSLTWPFSGTTRLQSTSQTVSDWYNTIIEWANYYDNTNPNNLINNLPQYILTNPENENYILFFAMIGQHFDTIYFYTKAIENSRNLTYSSTGIADKLLFDKLKSMSWEALNLGVDTKLWEYIYGEDSDGNVTQTNPAKKRTNEIWRRIINNLPYLLKHKGTRRGIHALMSCYGIPSSNLSIMEFGGPEKTDEAKGKLLVDNFSYAYGMKSGDSIIVTTPNVKTIEFFVKPAYAGNFTLASAGSNLVISGSVNSSYGKVKFGTIETPSLPLFNGRFFGISVTNWGSYRQLDIIQTEGERLIFSASVTGNSTLASSNLTIGTTFTGSIDEFRVWNQPLSQSVFLQHVYYPEMINGNHISASTTDLEVRLDFEYPKDLKTKNKLLNVCPSINLGSHNRNYYEDNNTTTGMTGRTMLSAAAVVNNSYTDYPYGFEVINRDGVLQIPSLGSSRYSTNKVRIEEQYLISDLSPKYRSTIKAFDNAPTDSNRVGLFVSPNKELNLDIAKSLGSDNLDDYIGDPSDRYKSNYKSLDGLRNYYFGRVHNRNVYEYIDVIKNYEKAMFEDLKKMLPARVKATTGLLIEPHFLERSKYEYTKPSGSNEYYEGVTEYQSEIKSYNEQFETVIDANLGEKLLGENEQYESIIDANLSENIFGENEQYSTTIFANDDINLSGESENYETTINAKFDLPTKTKQLDLENNNLLTANTIYQDIGFSVYAQNGNAIWNYYDTDGSLKKERVSINLVTEQKLKTFDRYNVVNGGVGDPRGGFTTTSSLYTETTITIQEWTSSTAPPTPQIGGNIINVQPVDGYLPIHYKYVGDLTTGLQNSFFKGCKNTSDTTLDGTAPIEVFVTNPNTIKVIGNETSGRDVNEPIIQVD